MKKTLLDIRNQALAFLFMLTFAVPILTPQLAQAGTNQCTWTGGGADNNWSTTANWSCSVGSAPGTGYDIIFPFSDLGGFVVNLNNDLLATNVYAGIWFTGDGTGCSGASAGYVITGNDIIMAGDIVSQQTGNCYMRHRFTTNLTFTANASISANMNNPIYTSFDLGDFYGGASTINIGANNVDFSLASIDTGVTLTGTGNVTFSGPGAADPVGYSSIFSGTNNVTGDLIISGVQLTDRTSGGALGAGAGVTYINDRGSLFFEQQGCSGVATNMSTSEDITFNGTGPNGYGSKIGGSSICGSAPVSTYYLDIFIPGYSIDLNGTININAEVRVDARPQNINFNGPINGAYQIILNPLYPDSTGALNVNGAPNNSLTANGTYQNSSSIITLSDSLPVDSILISGGYEVTITGVRGDVYIDKEGVLLGTGTVGNITSTDGFIRPGLSPGVLTTSNLLFDGATTVDMELGGTLAGEFDQFAVTGTVTLGNATLNTILYNGYVPANIGDSYTIINNDGVDAVTGTFNGIAEGGSVNVGAYRFDVSYVGGDGNDVVLTASYIPGPPGTGFGVIKNSYLMPILLAVISTILLAGMYEWKKSLRKRFARR